MSQVVLLEVPPATKRAENVAGGANSGTTCDAIVVKKDAPPTGLPPIPPQEASRWSSPGPLPAPYRLSQTSYSC